MKQLTENEKRTLQALIKMYEDTQEYGYIIGGAVYTAKQFKVRNYNHIGKPLLELKLIDPKDSKEAREVIVPENFFSLGGQKARIQRVGGTFGEIGESSLFGSQDCKTESISC